LRLVCDRLKQFGGVEDSRADEAFKVDAIVETATASVAKGHNGQASVSVKRHRLERAGASCQHDAGVAQ